MNFRITMDGIVLLRLSQLLVAVTVAFAVLGLAGVIALVLGEGNDRKYATKARRFRVPAACEGRPGLLTTP